ncbi:50S ribosomal subunit L30 [Pseudomassariella vexata]|uniref:Large ribosomal subunit protein mL46 n=1 Tax=Pseudomassariella vexata TaxID=1141098 RepID=A0A1Y2ED51_9PEZI|nr:50S ribosomal subunit L30 [Pseudomassariella vexata]ORY69501.1 50S ribosomal subunit L30 [Pseudomassariella vexata]
MTSSSRGGNAAAALLKRRPNVCASCRTTQFLRPYSAGAETSQKAEANPHPPTTSSRRDEYRIKSGIILSRAPLVTRALSPFENAFFFYQKRLNERLVLPFRHELFFKNDTAPDLDWRIKFNERGQLPAKELGRYYPKGRNAWNDELLVGSTLSDEERIREILLKDAENRVTEDGEEAQPDEIVPVERPMPRVTEADKTNDVRRLDRKLDRTLYLVVQASDGVWQFPNDDVPTYENLHEAAKRVLDTAAGVNMNTWIVGRVPAAHYVAQPEFDEKTVLKRRGEKVFFLKGRIMAGQANLKDNALGYKDFNWLTKDELREKLPFPYFRSVRNMMADR